MQTLPFNAATLTVFNKDIFNYTTLIDEEVKDL